MSAERVVFKYEIPQPGSTGRAFVDLPARVRPLSVGLQGETMVLWALVDPAPLLPDDEQASGPRRLIVCNTGHEVPGFPDGARFLGTVTTDGIVWHVFDGDAETTA